MAGFPGAYNYPGVGLGSGSSSRLGSLDPVNSGALSSSLRRERGGASNSRVGGGANNN